MCTWHTFYNFKLTQQTDDPAGYKNIFSLLLPYNFLVVWAGANGGVLGWKVYILSKWRKMNCLKKNDNAMQVGFCTVSCSFNCICQQKQTSLPTNRLKVPYQPPHGRLCQRKNYFVLPFPFVLLNKQLLPDYAIHCFRVKVLFHQTTTRWSSLTIIQHWRLRVTVNTFCLWDPILSLFIDERARNPMMHLSRGFA